MCLLCKESITVFKDFNLKHHFSTKHASKYENLSADEMNKKAIELANQLQQQQNVFVKQSSSEIAITKVSCVLA